jgi:hypothetical protein
MSVSLLLDVRTQMSIAMTTTLVLMMDVILRLVVLTPNILATIMILAPMILAALN